MLFRSLCPDLSRRFAQQARRLLSRRVVSQSAIDDRLGRSAGDGSEDGDGGGHSFERDDAEVFVRRGVQERDDGERGGEEESFLSGGHVEEEEDVLGGGGWGGGDERGGGERSGGEGVMGEGEGGGEGLEGAEGRDVLGEEGVVAACEG